MYNTIISTVSSSGSLTVPVVIRRKFNIEHRQPILVYEERNNLYIKKMQPEELLKFHVSGGKKGKISRVRKPYHVGIPKYLRNKYKLDTGTRVIFSIRGNKVLLIPMNDEYFNNLRKLHISDEKI